MVKIVLMPSQFPFILLAFSFIDSLSAIAISFSTLVTLLSSYPVILWLVLGILVLVFVSVTLGLAHMYRVLGAHLDPTSERYRQICWAVVGFQLLPILLALLGGLIGFVLYYNTPRPRACEDLDLG